MSKKSEEMLFWKKPFLTAFFNNWKGAVFCRTEAFNFKDMKFMTYPGCPYSEELQAAKWGLETESGLVIGYSKADKIGFIAVDLQSVPESERANVEPSPEHYAMLQQVIDQIDPPPIPKRLIEVPEDDE